MLTRANLQQLQASGIRLAPRAVAAPGADAFLEGLAVTGLRIEFADEPEQRLQLAHLEPGRDARAMVRPDAVQAVDAVAAVDVDQHTHGPSVSVLTRELLYRLNRVRGRLRYCDSCGFNRINQEELRDALVDLELQMEVEGLR